MLPRTSGCCASGTLRNELLSQRDAPRRGEECGNTKQSANWITYLGLEFLPFSDDETQGGREAFFAEPFVLGDLLDGVVVAAFEVDDALKVIGGHIRSF